MKQTLIRILESVQLREIDRSAQKKVRSLRRPSFCFASNAGVLFASLVLAISAHAQIYYSGEGTKNATPMNGCVKWYTDRERKTLADVTPAANDGNVYVFLSSAKMSGTTFPAKAYWGCDGSLEGESPGSFSVYVNKYTHRFDDCTLVSGAFQVQDGTAPAVLAGNYTLLDGKEFKFMSFSGNNNFTIGPNAVFTSGEKSVLTFSVDKSPANAFHTFSIEGNLSGFKGKFNTSTLGRPQGPNIRVLVSFVSATSFGDPSVSKTNALTLCQSNYLYVAETAVQSSTRGITMDLAANKRAGVYAAAGKNWALTAPVTGKTGIFSKIGAGKTTLNGTFDFPTIDVEEGTLALGAQGVFNSNLAVHVASGAKLVLNQEPQGLSLTCDDGGSVVYEIAFDATDGTTPLSLSAAEFAIIKARFPDGIALSLSQSIALPQVETLRLPMLKITDGTAVASDFIDVTAKTDGLPRTHFETETNDGVETVYLVARPVIDYASSKDKSLMTAANWTNGKLPGPGADYRKPNTVGKGLSRTGSGSSIKEYVFGGDSLTVCGNPIRNYAGYFFVPEMIVYGNSGVLCASGDSGAYRNKTLSGTYRFINNETTETSEISYQQTTSFDIQATFVGSGRLRIKSNNDAMVPVRISGDNSDFTGKLILGLGGTNYWMGLVITNATALGGALAEAAADGVTFTTGKADCSRLSMTVEKDVVFNAANRGWKADYLTLAANADSTLTIDEPSFAVSGALSKKGLGTLALKTTLSGSGIDTVPVSVEEGFVKALATTAWSAASFTVREGAGFEVDLSTADDSLRTYGVRAAAITPAGETIAVRGLFATNDMAPLEGIDVAICTVPSTNPDLSEVLKPKKTHRHSCSIKKIELTGDDAGLVTYALHVEQTGFLLIVK